MATPSLYMSMNLYIMRSLEPENGRKMRELARLARNFDEYMESDQTRDSFISTLGGIISDYKGDHGCTENDIIDSAEHRVAIIDAILESLGPDQRGHRFLNTEGEREVERELGDLGSTSSDSSSSEVLRSQVQRGSGGGRASSGYKNTRSKKKRKRNSTQKRVSKKNNRTKRRKKTRRTRRTRRRTIKGGG